MPDVGHVAVGLLAGRWYARDEGERMKAMAAFSVVSLLPDIDLLGRWLGCADGTPLGHRGAFHCLAAACLAGGMAGWLGRRWSLPWRRTALCAGLVMASHGALDMFDRGSLGVAYLWPFSSAHRFWPWRFLPGPPPEERWLSWEGARVVLTGALPFLPLFAWATRPARAQDRRIHGPRKASPSC